MGREGMELVQGDQAPPSCGKTGCVGVGGQHLLEIRTAEQVEHGEVGQAVAAVRGRVDENRARRGEHDVASPQVPVDPGGRTVVVIGTRGDPITDGIDHAGIGPGEVPHVHRLADERSNPLLGEVAAPRALGVVGLGLPADPAVSEPTGRRSPEGGGTRGVRDGQCSAEVRRRGRGGRCR